MSHKKILIIAGPNGAGKTTFAQEFLPNEARCRFFINADLIAAGLSPFQSERVAIKAGRMALEEIATQTKRGVDFAVETTLAGRSYVRLIRQWRNEGYLVKLIFLALASSEQAIARVHERVQQGGHHIPDEVVRKRFGSGLVNLESAYRDEVDFWQHFDMSGDDPKLQDTGTNTSAVGGSDDADMEGSLPALIRAAKRARELAQETSTRIAVMRRGQLVLEIPRID
jgi:predicted ABC-type ATPase